MDENKEVHEEEEICNMSSILDRVANLYASHLMSDITLVVGEMSYPTHRVILSASSEVFQCMLMNPQWKETNESVIHLHEDKKAAEFFNLFLKYLYTGQVRVSVESALPLLSLADKYNIKDLVVLSRDYMLKNVAVAAVKGFFISWLQYSLTSAIHIMLANELKNFLCLNLALVGKSSDFIDFDPNSLISLLQQNDLVIESEGELFDIVEGWLMLKKGQIAKEELSDEEKENHMHDLVEGVCAYIRYPMMTFSDLAAIPLRPIVAIAKEFFMDRVALGFSFHAGHPLPVDPEYLQFTPRLYTSDSFAIEMAIPEIHKVEDFQTYCAGFFSLQELPQTTSREQNEIPWAVDFFPRGIQFHRAKLINIFYQAPNANTLEIPECILRSIRVRCTCRAFAYGESFRYKIAVVVHAKQGNSIFKKTLHTRIQYITREHRTVIFDHLIPYEELNIDKSIYLYGKNSDTLKITVIITPFHQNTTNESPPLDFK